MNEKIRVVIADDNPHQVLGLVELLGYSDEIEVVGKANTAQQAVSLAKNLAPNVILLDMIWYKDEQEGLAAIRQIRANAPDTRILAMTAYDEVIEKARQAGADRAIHKDYLYSKTAMVEHIKATDEARHLPVVAQAPLERLSKREQETLEWMCDGLSDKEIAVKLFIQPNTVKKFNVNIYRKLDVSGRAEAIAMAIRNGLVQPKDNTDKVKKE